MRRIFYLAITALLFACESDETPILATSYWDTPHTALMGLGGDVSQVVEFTSSWEETKEEEEHRVKAAFNANRQLTDYDPTDIEPEASTRWIGVAAVSYHYQYDAAGRMTEVNMHELGSEPVTYTLTYGEHNYYIPLIFPVGTINLFLIKGLNSIESNDGSVKYHFDGSKASYRKTSWGGMTELSYEYASGNMYPTRQRMEVSRNNALQQAETTDYLFDPNGSLVSTIQVKKDGQTEEVLEQTTIRYITGRHQSIASKQLEADGELTEWEYTYGQDGLLMGVVCRRDGEYIPEEESFSFSAVDAFGNWTESRQQWSSMIDWGHQDGTFRVRREISYR